MTLRSPPWRFAMPSDNEFSSGIPHGDLTDDELEAVEWDYSDRAPTDYVVSGPLGEEGNGRGRWFASWEDAEWWALRTYGDRLKHPIPEANIYGDRWAFLVRAKEK